MSDAKLAKEYAKDYQRIRHKALEQAAGECEDRALWHEGEASRFARTHLWEMKSIAETAALAYRNAAAAIRALAQKDGE